MDIHDQLKLIRDEEIAKDPPPYKLEMSTPSHLKEFHTLEPRECKVFYKSEMLEYKEKICRRIRQRYIELGIELKIDIENADSVENLYGDYNT